MIGVEEFRAEVRDWLADNLVGEYAALKGWMLDERGRLREHVSVFVNDARVSSLDHPVTDRDEIYVLHAISGGQVRGG